MDKIENELIIIQYVIGSDRTFDWTVKYLYLYTVMKIRESKCYADNLCYSQVGERYLCKKGNGDMPLVR